MQKKRQNINMIDVNIDDSEDFIRARLNYMNKQYYVLKDLINYHQIHQV